MGKLMELIGILVFAGVTGYGLYYLFLTASRKTIKVEKTYSPEEVEEIMKAMKAIKDHRDKYGDQNVEKL